MLSRSDLTLASLVVAIGCAGSHSTESQESSSSREARRLHPNEPAGYVRFAENDFTQLPPEGRWRTYDDAHRYGRWSKWSTSHSVEDGRLSTRFGRGLPPGSGPGNINGWDSRDGEYDEFYVHFEDYEINAPDFEMQDVAPGAKLLGYFGVGGDVSWQAEIYFILTEPEGDQGAYWDSFVPVLYRQGTPTLTPKWPRNNWGTFLYPGTKHDIEMVFKINDVGSANGVFKMWIDGTKIHDHADIEWRDAAGPKAFHMWHFAPIWGGGGNISKTRSDFIYIGHVYMSGVPR